MRAKLNIGLLITILMASSNTYAIDNDNTMHKDMGSQHQLHNQMHDSHHNHMDTSKHDKSKNHQHDNQNGLEHAEDMDEGGNIHEHPSANERLRDKN